MAMLLLFSTVSFTVEKHFCGDVLIDVAVFSDVHKCGLELDDSQQTNVVKKSCCKDTLEIVEGQDELTVKTFDDLDVNQQQFLTAYTYSFNSLFEVLPKQIIPHNHYRPPNLIVDVQILDQVFLI